MDGPIMYPNSFLAIQKQDGWNVVKQIRDEEWKARTLRTTHFYQGHRDVSGSWIGEKFSVRV